MTEILEVDSFIKQLDNLEIEIEYESNTTPGESDEVKRLFKDAVEKIEDAKTYLKVAAKRMQEEI
jgi:hypothetical protein